MHEQHMSNGACDEKRPTGQGHASMISAAEPQILFFSASRTYGRATQAHSSCAEIKSSSVRTDKGIRETRTLPQVHVHIRIA